MFKVRQTWDQHFTDRKMYYIDVKVNNIDHAWPLSTPTCLPQVGYVAISSCKMYICKKTILQDIHKHKEQSENLDFFDFKCSPFLNLNWKFVLRRLYWFLAHWTKIRMPAIWIDFLPNSFVWITWKAHISHS
jgi:hypothetical protein